MREGEVREGRSKRREGREREKMPRIHSYPGHIVYAATELPSFISVCYSDSDDRVAQFY